MFVRIQRGTSTPISRQIDAQIRAQLSAGKLQPGDQMPSVRQLARELAVNVNTVFRVYERLAADGLIDLRHGDGTYVARRRKNAAASAHLAQHRDFANELDALVRRALMLGITEEELSSLLEESIERVQEDKSVVTNE